MVYCRNPIAALSLRQQQNYDIAEVMTHFLLGSAGVRCIEGSLRMVPDRGKQKGYKVHSWSSEESLRLAGNTPRDDLTRL